MQNDNHTLLVCTVGGTPEPLVKSLVHWRPARVLFLPSEQTRTHVDSVLRAYAEHVGQALSPGCYRVCAAADAEELSGCLRTIKLLEHEVEDWRRRGAEYQVVADFTAGTKCMSAALALQARRWSCQFSYVGGGRRSKDGVGVVETGSERVVHSANPWDALGFQAAEDFAVLFDEQAFAAAAVLAETAVRNVSPPRKRELTALKLLAEAYDAWDRFDHKTALARLREAGKYDNDLQAVCGDPKASELRARACAHVAYLCQLVERTSPSMQHVTDLLANAQRRKREGRNDDGVASPRPPRLRGRKAAAPLKPARGHGHQVFRLQTPRPKGRGPIEAYTCV